MKVERWNSERDGQLTKAALRRKLELRGYTVTRYVYPPGTCFPPHAHDVDKANAVLSGRFRITLEEESHALAAGDLVVVPRGVMHDAVVVGGDEVVSLDAVRTR